MNKNLTDEEYLVNCAIAAQKSDSYTAKSWLLTARTMFPKSYKIQYEEYNLQKNAGNLKEASNCLLKIYKEFQQCEELWAEIKMIWTALNSDSADEDSKTFRELFNHIPKDMQQHILLCAAEKSKDTFEQCTIIFLVLKHFPRCIRQHGIPLIEMFMAAESRLHPYNALNVFRILLVTDVLPLLLKSSQMSIAPEQYFQLLLKGIEYYIFLLIKPSQSKTSGDSHEFKQIWKDLFELINMFAKKLKWELQDLFISGNNVESQWQQLHNLYLYFCETQDKSRAMLLQPQLMICTVILFIYCLYQYSVLSNPSWFDVSSENSQPSLILVKDTTNHRYSSSNANDMVSSSSNLKVSPLIKTKLASIITQNFVIAVKCYRLLISDSLFQAEFNQIQRTLKMELWPWYYSFETEALIYQEKYDIAINKLSLMQNYSKPVDTKLSIKSNLQISSCFYSIADYKTCCDKIFDVISKLKSLESTSMNQNLNSSTSNLGHDVLLISLDKQEILKYSINLLISCLKQAFKQNVRDLILGHWIVLLQYDWDNCQNEFLEILEMIKQCGSFTYNSFFLYIINIDILEEFAYLGNNANRNFINLNILPTNNQCSKSRTITRGVNKEVKEDFRQALEKQVTSEHGCIEDLILTFIVNEHESIISCFSS